MVRFEDHSFSDEFIGGDDDKIWNILQISILLLLLCVTIAMNLSELSLMK